MAARRPLRRRVAVVKELSDCRILVDDDVTTSIDVLVNALRGEDHGNRGAVDAGGWTCSVGTWPDCYSRRCSHGLSFASLLHQLQHPAQRDL